MVRYLPLPFRKAFKVVEVMLEIHLNILTQAMKIKTYIAWSKTTIAILIYFPQQQGDCEISFQLKEKSIFNGITAFSLLYTVYLGLLWGKNGE